MAADKVIIKGYMFHPRVENWIGAKIGGAKVVTVRGLSCSNRHTKLKKKRDYPANSDAVFATARYSASVEERVTPFCFFVDHETG